MYYKDINIWRPKNWMEIRPQYGNGQAMSFTRDFNAVRKERKIFNRGVEQGADAILRALREELKNAWNDSDRVLLLKGLL